MARISIDLKRHTALTTAALTNRADWVNTSAQPVSYAIFEAGDTENEFPKKPSNGRNFTGLPWPSGRVIPTGPGERLHIISRDGDANVEGHEAAA